MQKITPCLWFDGNGEEAIEFYSGIFKNAKMSNVLRNGKDGPGPQGSVLAAYFELDGVEFLALNGGPDFKFNEAISLSVDCKSQEEVDHFWTGLTQGGGEPGPCGWLKDRFGISWQVVPDMLPKLLRDSDKAKASRVMQAMMQMSKIDIATLEKAAKG